MGELSGKLEVFDNTYHGGEAGEYFVETSALRDRLQLLRGVLLTDLGTSDQKAPQSSLLELDAILEELA